MQSLRETKKELRNLTLDKVRVLFVDTYVHLSPAKCDKCKNIYECHTTGTNVRCLVCDKSLCPSCCPNSESTNSFLFPICSPCSSGFLKGRNTPVDESISEDTHENDEDNDDTNAPSVTPTDPTQDVTDSQSSSAKEQSDKVCSFFVKNSCKFGRKGVGCSYSHPKQCFRWLKSGPKGCEKGRDCEYFHTRLCSGSLKDLTCFKESCRHTHLPRTVRNPVPADVPATKQTQSSSSSSGSGRKMAPDRKQSVTNPLVAERSPVEIPGKDFSPCQGPLSTRQSGGDPENNQCSNHPSQFLNSPGCPAEQGKPGEKSSESPTANIQGCIDCPTSTVTPITPNNQWDNLLPTTSAPISQGSKLPFFGNVRGLLPLCNQSKTYLPAFSGSRKTIAFSSASLNLTSLRM